MNNTRNTQNTDYSKYNSAPDREVKRGALNCHSDGLPERIQPLHTLSRISKFTPFIKKFFPLTKREGNNKRKELINLSTYKLIYL